MEIRKITVTECEDFVLAEERRVWKLADAFWKARIEKAFDNREKELFGDEIWLHGPTLEQIMNERGHRVDELRILKREILEG